MARINKTDVIQKAVNDLALSQSTDKIPNETLDKIQLVYSLNKQFSSFTLSGASSSSGTITLATPTVDLRSEVYITSIDYDLIKDSACDVGTGTLGVSITTDFQNIAKNILQIGVIALTAQTNHIHMDLTFPIKIKQNSNITSGGSFTAGVMIRGLCITGFTTTSN